jgi:hypothetical protein
MSQTGGTRNVHGQSGQSATVAVDLGVVLGLAGIATGAVSLLYARTQATAAQGQAAETRRQAEQATHMTVLAANQQLFERLHSARERLGKSPHLLTEMKEHIGPLADAMEKAGGFSDYILLREVMEIFHDAYFMRRDGVITDAYWKDITGNQMVWARLPSFHTSFEAAVRYGLVHEDFVAAFRDVLKGVPMKDPKRA